MAGWSCRRPVHTEHPRLQLDRVAAIQSLLEKHCQTIIFRDFEELSIDEIAGKLLLTHEAIRSRIYRGPQMAPEYVDDPCRRWMPRHASGSAVSATSYRPTGTNTGTNTGREQSA